MKPVGDTGEIVPFHPRTPADDGAIRIDFEQKPKTTPQDEDRRELKIIDAGDDIGEIPPREWLLGNTFCRGFVSGLLAEGGASKTSLRILQALSVATGRPLSDEHVFQRGRVLFLMFEDGDKELRRRVRAARLHHGIPRDQVKGHLFLTAPTRDDGKLMFVDEKGRLQKGPLAETLERYIQTLRLDLVILDPLVKTHDVEENLNSQMDELMQLLSNLAVKHNIAADILHHVSKGLKEPGNADMGRGASAVKDGARLVYTLMRMSKEDASGFGISEEDRINLVRVDSAKVNIAPRAEKAQWYRIVGVPLGNATADYPSGDNVAALEPWTPPDAWEGLDTKLLNAILDDIDEGLPNGSRYSSASSAGEERAAWRVVQAHAPQKSDAGAKKIIKAWTESGLLFNDDYYDEKQRKTLKGLHVDAMKRPGRVEA